MPRKRIKRRIWKCPKCIHAGWIPPHEVGTGPNWCMLYGLRLEYFEVEECTRYAKKTND